MKHKKRWIIVGILFIFLIKIFYVSALGLGTGLGGSINIPLGNQTFSNETISPDDTDYVEDIDDADITDDYEDNLETDENEEDSDYSDDPVTNTTTNNTTTHPETQSSTDPSSSTNSNSFNEFVRNFIEKISPNKNIKDDDKNYEVIIESESEYEESNSNQAIAGYKGQDVKIILVINTLCLFFAFVTLRNYSKGLEEE